MKNIVVFAGGNGSNFQAVIDAVNAKNIKGKITGLIAGRADIYSIERAKKHNIPFCVICSKDYVSQEEFDRANLDKCAEWGADLIVFAGYLAILGPGFIEKYRNKIINIHPSLIPSFCGSGFYGLKVHEAALAKGVKITGATTHFVDEGTDTGPIIMQRAVEVLDDDTPESLQKRVLEVEHEVLVETIRLFCEDSILIKSVKKITADEDKISVKKITADEHKILIESMRDYAK